MKILTGLAITLALSLAVPNLSIADDDHGHGRPKTAEGNMSPMGDQADMMQNMMSMMMPMMMQMRNQMMGGGPAMMDGTMMQMMMGNAGPENARATILSRLKEFDKNKDGTLSLSEYKNLHAVMTRDIIVDRFQHLDANGDGQINKKEMMAPLNRMGMGPGMSGLTNKPVKNGQPEKSSKN